MTMEYGTITGRLVAAVADTTDDPDVNPDIVPISGTVTFTPSVKAILVVSEDITVVPAPIVAALDANGYVSLNGMQGVTVLATNSTYYNPTGWTYRVSFDNLSANGRRVTFDSYNIEVPVGANVDLSFVTPITGSTGTAIVRGEKGDKGDTGATGPQGIPGNNVPTDTAVAGYIAQDGSQTQTAGDGRYVRPSTLDAQTAALVPNLASATRSALNKPYANRSTSFDGASAFVKGAAADYTGRRGVVGTGTDDRAAIQAALDAATQPNGTGWYAYLQGRTVSVKLPAGTYLIGAPAGGSGPSLRVPRGVHLDTSDAMLFFDYPTTADRTWCGIQVEPEASLTVGTLQPTGRTAPADTKQLYDGVRVFGSDNYWSKVAGLPGRHAEIKGFQGASVRLVGTWVTYLENLHLTSQFGVVTSSLLPNNVYGYAIPSDMPFPTTRGMTDVFIDNCYFDGNSYGGFLGPITGTDANSNVGGTLDFTNGALQLYIRGTLFEQMNSLPIYTTGYCVSIVDCAFEETGNSIAQLAWFQTVRSVYIQNFRVNFTGVNVPGPSGSGSSRPIGAFRTSNVLALTIDSGYVHNTVNNNIFLVQPDSQLPGAFHVGPVIIDSLDYKQNAAYGGKNTIATASAWNAGHLVLGGSHVWTDANGVLRIKASAPTSDTDGVAVGAQS